MVNLECRELEQILQKRNFHIFFLFFFCILVGSFLQQTSTCVKRLRYKIAQSVKRKFFSIHNIRESCKYVQFVETFSACHTVKLVIVQIEEQIGFSSRLIFILYRGKQESQNANLVNVQANRGLYERQFWQNKIKERFGMKLGHFKGNT